jgi:hypothetical protein
VSLSALETEEKETEKRVRGVSRDTKFNGWRGLKFEFKFKFMITKVAGSAHLPFW